MDRPVARRRLPRDRAQAVDGAIVHEALESGDALPAGWLDEQGPGRYRPVRGRSGRLRAHRRAAGLEACAVSTTAEAWEGERQGSQFTIEAVETEAPPTALLGVRACELAAIAIQERVFLEGP